MSRANWLWGAPRIHGELLKLGIEVAESTVAKYMVKRPGRPGCQLLQRGSHALIARQGRADQPTG
jgi:hypothetical protein